MSLYYHNNVIAGDEIPRASLKVWLDPGVYECYPGSGTTAYDLSGNANNGTMTYSQLATLVPGVFEFQGTYAMDIPNLGASFGQNDFSMCIWVNVDVYDDPVNVYGVFEKQCPLWKNNVFAHRGIASRGTGKRNASRIGCHISPIVHSNAF